MKPLTEIRAKILEFIRSDIVAKRIVRTKTGYKLQPENAEFQPIIVENPHPDFRFAGPVVGLVRRMV